MGDPLDYLDRLAERARQEVPPRGDVVRPVLNRLLHLQNPFLKPMLVVATGYAAVACGALAYAIVLLNAITDPITSMIQSASIPLP